MLFNSFEFALFLLITLVVYYLPFLRRLQVPVLILASFVFYASHTPWLTFLLLLSIAINAVMSAWGMVSEGVGKKKVLAGVGIALNLAVLLSFKYGPLLSRTLHLQNTSFGDLLIGLPLPIGISFFTFQGISLMVDVFRQKPGDPHYIKMTSPLKYVIDTAFFKAFFPQLVAGPIMKAHDFYWQIAPKKFRAIKWEDALCTLIIGFFLKMVIADNLKDLTFWLAYPYFLKFSTATLLTLLFGYSMQIFADFAGYSLIAIGLARLFGYELMTNFNFPYLSQSLSEFWRRWHISLSTWLRDYLYIPLGGNRKGEVRAYANLMIVMALGGLWHGAAWSYMVWGVYHGAGLCFERLCRGNKPAETETFSIARMIGIFVFVTVGWLLFKLPNFAHVIEFAKACCTNFFAPDDPNLITYILVYSVPIIGYHVLSLLPVEASVRQRARVWVYATCLFFLLLNCGSPGSFIYFQF
ncbi:MAG: MBOAT family O-acyltransferase [Limisphaerales bacterium]